MHWIGAGPIYGTSHGQTSGSLLVAGSRYIQYPFAHRASRNRVGEGCKCKNRDAPSNARRRRGVGGSGEGKYSVRDAVARQRGSSDLRPQQKPEKTVFVEKKNHYAMNNGERCLRDEVLQLALAH